MIRGSQSGGRDVAKKVPICGSYFSRTATKTAEDWSESPIGSDSRSYRLFSGPVYGGQCGFPFPVAPLHCLSPGPGASPNAVGTDAAKAAIVRSTKMALFVLLTSSPPLELPDSEESEANTL
jgi:hypothetical protein